VKKKGFSMNLFEEFDNIVDNNFKDKLVSLLPTEKKENVDTAIHGIFYTLLAGLVRRSNSEMSSGMLLNQINDNYGKMSYIKELPETTVNKDYLDKCIKDGSKIISQIFPAYKSPLLSLISSYANTSKNGSVLISSVVSLVLVEILGQKVASKNMDKYALMNFLKEHHEPLFEKLPENLTEKMVPALGLQDLTNTKAYQPKKVDLRKTEDSTTSTTPTEESNYESDEEGGFNKKWIIALLAAIVLGVGGYFIYANKDKINLFNKSEAEIDESLAFQDSLNTAPKDTLTSDTLALAKADSLQNSQISDFVKLKNYMGDATKAAGDSFEFPTIQYVENSSDLSDGSNAIIDSLGILMMANARMQIKITAFSSSGDVKLNNKRAFSLKKALINRGIEAIKIDAVSGGVGEGFPQIKVVTK
jgi:outer membrane protein OmpA-like peptidoglycan-associated protein